jgi:GT2 family glycosyltransferase
MEPEEYPYVVCCVLNWNNYSDSRECVNSLLKVEYPNMDIVVIDNGSSDGSGERLREEFADINVELIGENRGFARGHNVGIRWALDNGADYVMVTSNDAIFPDTELLDKLIEFIETEGGVGMVTPEIRCYPDTDAVWFQEGRIDYSTGFPDHAKGSDNGELIYNDYISLVSTVIPVEVFEEVGLLPGDWFLYHEDMDFSTQVRDQGYDLVTFPQATVYHRGSSTSGSSLRPVRSYYPTRNRWIWARKYEDRIQPWVFRKKLLKHIIIQVARRIRYLAFPGLFAFLTGVVHGIQGKDGRGPYP